MAHAIHSKTISSKKTGKASSQKGNLILNAVSSLKAKRQAKRILKAINEAKEIHKGNRKGKSFDDFLEEL